MSAKLKVIDKGDGWELYQVQEGRSLRKYWRWRRKAGNGEVIGASTESYSRSLDCVHNMRANGYTG